MFKTHKIIEKQELYLISDEEIQKGDWVYYGNKEIIGKVRESHNKDNWFCDRFNDIPYSAPKIKWKKIIASTDSSLGLPTFPKSFLKNYCKLERIDEVLVEYYLDEVSILDRKNGENIDNDWVLKVQPDNTIITKEVVKKDSWNKEEIDLLIKKAYREGYEDALYK